jgi:hypothetical protein
MRRAGLRRIAIIKAVDVGEQDDAAGTSRLRNARREPVVVAEADFLGRDAVVLVDDRNHTQGEQPVERRGGVEVAAAMFEIVERDEDLRCGQPFGAQNLGPNLRQCNLSGRCRRLRILKAGAAALGKAEPASAERNRPRRHHGNLLPGAATCRDVGGDPGQPVAPHRAAFVDEQRRPDLDDQPRAGGRRE